MFSPALHINSGVTTKSSNTLSLFVALNRHKKANSMHTAPLISI